LNTRRVPSSTGQAGQAFNGVNTFWVKILRLGIGERQIAGLSFVRKPGPEKRILGIVSNGPSKNKGNME